MGFPIRWVRICFRENIVNVDFGVGISLKSELEVKNKFRGEFE